jgi:hypothetical protein
MSIHPCCYLKRKDATLDREVIYCCDTEIDLWR